MKILKTFGLFLAVLTLLASCDNQTTVYDTIKADSSTAIVKTTNGSVAGYIDRDIYTFKGIPYAKAERFMPPEDAESWTGVRSSRTYGAVCPIPAVSLGNDANEFGMQHDYGIMNEDCLNLNIWTQNINNSEKKPVMVWLHGGGYSSGSSHELPSYDGLNLSKTRDVVVVSINHRLNILGFLDLSGVSEKYKYSANVGMLDQVAALKWIQNNIQNFGGDPNNVTIFGQSGGGGKVCTLMQMPAAKGLFHKGISQSNGTMAYNDTTVTRLVGLNVLEELGLSKDQVDQLQTIPYEELYRAGSVAMNKTSQYLREQGIASQRPEWAPSIDGEVIPYQLGSLEGLAISKDLPLMIGTTKNEVSGMMSASVDPDASLEEVKEILKRSHGDKTDDFVAAIQKDHPDMTQPTEMLSTDIIFRPIAVYVASQKSAMEGSAPTYLYMFSWQSPILDGMYKAMHCMEIGFAFNNIAANRELTGDSEETYALADEVSKAWTNFAKTGNPNGEGVTEWPEYNNETAYTMLLNTPFEAVSHYDKSLIEFLSNE